MPWQTKVSSQAYFMYKAQKFERKEGKGWILKKF